MTLSNADKKKCREALDVLETRTLHFDWTSQWLSVHDGATSQLGGLKPGCRQDSADPKHYHVGLFRAANKRIQPPPLVEASFPTAPSSADAIKALRAAVDAA
ncbi:hypothetical protein C8Q80DRAFT_1122700 [Daedaleopsis nitida]|nr:hypothetical protein C8Q80DRAFT_1122700 [Daedaleopsis nitida]